MARFQFGATIVVALGTLVGSAAAQQRAADGVALNDDGLPQLRISPVYKRLLDNKHDESAAETRAYVKEKFRSALWLLKSVDQRQKTIIKVANSIIQFQKEFLDHGIESKEYSYQVEWMASGMMPPQASAMS